MLTGTTFKPVYLKLKPCNTLQFFSKDLLEGAKPMKPEQQQSLPAPSPTKLALRQILDKWVACTISVEDAEKQLRDLFATNLGGVDVQVGQLVIRSNGWPYGGEYKLDGVDLPDWQKISLTFEAGCRPKIVLETTVRQEMKEVQR